MNPKELYTEIGQEAIRNLDRPANADSLPGAGAIGSLILIVVVLVVVGGPIFFGLRRAIRSR